MPIGNFHTSRMSVQISRYRTSSWKVGLVTLLAETGLHCVEESGGKDAATKEINFLQYPEA
ncbi:hypothetical protein [Desulfovibrio sp. JC022]|uniref:hypothetical protein n=1 Tax=Desulfovibrio sp. JC022 TaxID=2593642 RepID=UPI0013D43E4F|nr:hypothetical protein [Desulfovibrio sp. JC022]NDV22296.1 hypothetical protein [Desulfovibrio sp. JC022]